MSKYREWSEADLRQLLLLMTALQDSLGTMPPGTRMLLEAHGWGRGRLQGMRRTLWKAKGALIAVLAPKKGDPS